MRDKFINFIENKETRLIIWFSILSIIKQEPDYAILIQNK